MPRGKKNVMLSPLWKKTFIDAISLWSKDAKIQKLFRSASLSYLSEHFELDGLSNYCIYCKFQFVLVVGHTVRLSIEQVIEFKQHPQ